MPNLSPPTVLFPPRDNPAIGSAFVSASNGQLALAGERYVCFGVNIDQYAALTPLVWNGGKPKLDPSLTDSVCRQLDNLVRAGVRGVRLHGFDLLDGPNIFSAFGRPAVANPTTRQLDPNFLMAFGFLWSELRKRNLRAVITLHYRRQLTAADRPEWPCPTFDECLAKPFPGTKAGEMSPWFWFDPGLERLQAEFNRQLLRWVCPQTGIALGDDPGLLAVILQNERSLVKDNPYEYVDRPVLQSLWSAAREAYRQKWAIDARTLNKVKWQQCLADLETQFFARQTANVRTLTGALVIAGTYYGNGPYSMLIAPHAAGDALDFHFYSRYAPSELNGFCNGRASGDARTRFAATAAGCDWGKPLFCSEWGGVGQYTPLVRDPESERAVLLERAVSAAVAQDVDCLFLYSWGHSPLVDGQYAKHTVYDFRDDVVFLAGAPSQIARFQDLTLRPQPAAPPAALALSGDRLYGTGVGPAYRLVGPYTDPDLYSVPANQKIEMRLA